MRTKLHSQRVPGGVHRLAHCSAEELVAEAIRKGEGADSGAVLYAPLKLGDGVIGMRGAGRRLRAPSSATSASTPQGGLIGVRA